MHNPPEKPGAPQGSGENTRRTLRTLLALSGASARRTLTRLRQVLTEDPSDDAPRRAELAGAQSLRRSAGELKGGAAKLAQLMAYFEGPDALAAASREELSALFDRIPGADPAGVRAVLERELGKPVAELFASYEAEPFAAASLGEVHGAVRHGDGAELAVKIQYPGVAEALAADLQSEVMLRRLTGGSMGGAVDPAAREALRAALLLEVDYQAEGRFMNRFHRALRGDAALRVPRYLPELSSARVLTAERLRGQRLPDFAAAASPAARGRIAAALFRYGFGAPLVHGLLNADPNPGNFLVLPEERLGLLDFGCCLELPEDVVTRERVLWQALLAGDGQSLRYALHRQGLLREAAELDSSRYRAWERCLAAPFERAGFRWSAAYAREFADHTTALVRGGRFTLPAEGLLLWRQRLGLSAVLGSLGAEADFRGELLALLRQVDMAPKGVR